MLISPWCYLAAKKKKKTPQVLSKLNFIHRLIDHFLRLRMTTTSKCEIETSTLMKLSRHNSSAFHHRPRCNSINLGRQPLSKGLFLPISKQCQAASSCLSYISEGGEEKQLYWRRSYCVRVEGRSHAEPRRIAFLRPIDFWSFDII